MERQSSSTQLSQLICGTAGRDIQVTGRHGSRLSLHSPDPDPFPPPQVDGEHCRLPWVLPGGKAWATLEGRHVVVHTACGLHLMYDWGSQVHLTVPSTFHGQLVGICGAFGGKDGPLDPPIDKRSWFKDLITNPCPPPQPNLDFTISCPTQPPQIYNAPKLCRLLQAPDGPFGRCLDHISPKPFLRICLQNICHTHGQHLGLCDALTAYTAACQEAGIPVKLWRGPKLCRECSSWVWNAFGAGCRPLMGIREVLT